MPSDRRVYRGDFAGWTDIAERFHITHLKLREPKYVWAEYDHDVCDGSALVIFRDGSAANGLWKTVYGSHCSCFGLEDQWKPEEFDVRLHLEAVKQGRELLSGPQHMINAATEWLRKRRVRKIA